MLYPSAYQRFRLAVLAWLCCFCVRLVQLNGFRPPFLVRMREELCGQFSKRGLTFEGDKKAGGKSKKDMATVPGSETFPGPAAKRPYMDTSGYSLEQADEAGFCNPTADIESPEHPIKSALNVKYFELDVISQGTSSTHTATTVPTAPALQSTESTTTTSLHAEETLVFVLNETAPATQPQSDLTLTAAKAQIASFTPHMTIMKTSQAIGPGRFKLKILPELYEEMVRCGPGAVL